MLDSAVVICIDGCGPEYLLCADTPNLDAIAKAGWSGTGTAVMPTVTNVNNASIVTGMFPREHGITSNWYMDRVTGEGVYMESADYLSSETVFERLAQFGLKSALLTAKDKLCTLLERGTFIAASAEHPPRWLVELVGAPPHLYSAEVNLWLLDAALAVLEQFSDLRFLYVSTTDFVMHTYPPEHAESQQHLYDLDQRIGKLAEELNGGDIAITADHGMMAKTVGVDAAKVLSNAGIHAEVVPIIKDRHVIHHQNLSGSAYVYLDEPKNSEAARACLQEVQGVEKVISRQEAVQAYHLHAYRIGDLMLLGDTRTVFGDLPDAQVEVRLRSHGSLHEQAVRIICHGPRFDGAEFSYSKDIVSSLLPLPTSDHETVIELSSSRLTQKSSLRAADDLRRKK